MISKHTYHRCGLCCLEVGRTFWKCGRADPSVISHWPAEITAQANNGDHQDGNLSCEMLVKVNHLYGCLLEIKYGRCAKPLICRQYPLYGEKCFREEALLNVDNV